MVFTLPKLRKNKYDGISKPSLSKKPVINLLTAIRKNSKTPNTKYVAYPDEIPPAITASSTANDIQQPGFDSPTQVISDFNIGIVETGKTEPVSPITPILSDINVIHHNAEKDSEGAEIVYGEVPPSETINESQVIDEAGPLDTMETSNDVKKQLFFSDDSNPDDVFESDDPITDVSSTTELFPIIDSPTEKEEVIRVESPFSEIDEPFDEREMRKEDPYILDLLQKEAELQEPIEVAIQEVPKKMSESNKQNGIDSILSLFNCNGDATSFFYDTLCAESSAATPPIRPYFNESFALNFIVETSIEGIPMLYHIPPSNPVDDDWTGRSVTMHLKPGDCRGQCISHPKLVWNSVAGGRYGSDVISFSMDILNIHSILDAIDDPTSETASEENLGFFSITTQSGEIHLFECLSSEEKDRVTTGIKNMLARMAYSIIAGDNHVLTELYGDLSPDEGQLPALKTISQSLNDISHAFLNSVTDT